MQMTRSYSSRNRALVRYILIPMVFMIVALLGGLRIDAESHFFVFVPPPLITLILSLLLMILFVRGHAIEWRSWIRSDQPALTNISHLLTLLTLYFASAQAFNSVLPERGLIFLLFSLFFLWTLVNNQFSNFDARRLLRSLVILFGMAFFLKHMLLASLFSPGGGFGKWLVSTFVDISTLGTIDFLVFAPATGYISFFTLALYVGGLMLLTPTPEPDAMNARSLIRAYQELPALERETVREAIAGSAIQSGEALMRMDTVETTSEIVTDRPTEETLSTRKPDA
jgi:drug/metabolite transporter superfamily protein YnfA